MTNQPMETKMNTTELHTENWNRVKAIAEHLKANVFDDWHPTTGYFEVEFSGVGSPADITELTEDGFVSFYHEELGMIIGVAWQIEDDDIVFIGVIQADGHEVANSERFSVSETLTELGSLDRDRDQVMFFFLLGDAAHIATQ